MPPNKVPATLRRWADKIHDVARDQDGWSIGLQHGWYCPGTETHAIFGSTLKEIARYMPDIVRCSAETCDMKECGPEADPALRSTPPLNRG